MIGRWKNQILLLGGFSKFEFFKLIASNLINVKKVNLKKIVFNILVISIDEYFVIGLLTQIIKRNHAQKVVLNKTIVISKSFRPHVVDVYKQSMHTIRVKLSSCHT